MGAWVSLKRLDEGMRVREDEGRVETPEAYRECCQYLAEARQASLLRAISHKLTLKNEWFRLFWTQRLRSAGAAVFSLLPL